MEEPGRIKLAEPLFSLSPLTLSVTNSATFLYIAHEERVGENWLTELYNGVLQYNREQNFTLLKGIILFRNVTLSKIALYGMQTDLMKKMYNNLIHGSCVCL